MRKLGCTNSENHVLVKIDLEIRGGVTFDLRYHIFSIWIDIYFSTNTWRCIFIYVHGHFVYTSLFVGYKNFSSKLWAYSH